MTSIANISTIRFATGLHNIQPSSRNFKSIFAQQSEDGMVTQVNDSFNVFDSSYANHFSAKNFAEIADTLLANVGIVAGVYGLSAENVASARAVVVGALVAAAPTDNQGIAIKNLLDDFAVNSVSDPVFGSVALAFNEQTERILSYISRETEGSDGNDEINGSSGNDRIYGKLGDDVLIGNDGNDILEGSGGNDVIQGGNGIDKIIGGPGNDTLNGGAQNDLIIDEGGNNRISGGDGDDNIIASMGNNVIFGDNGDDNISVANGDNLIDGGAGHDRISVFNGVNTINGNAGNDRIMSGSGNDTISGGTGFDTFVFYHNRTQSEDFGTHIDVITDFEVGIDKLNFGWKFGLNASSQQDAVQTAVSALNIDASEMQVFSAMALANLTDLGLSFATHGGDTYVLLESNGIGPSVSDVLVRLTGVTDSTSLVRDVADDSLLQYEIGSGGYFPEYLWL